MKNSLIVGLNDDLNPEEIKRVEEAIFHIKGVANVGPTVMPFEYYGIISEFQNRVATEVYKALSEPLPTTNR